MSRIRRPGAGGTTRAETTPGQLGWKPAIVLMLVALVDRIETGIVPGVLPLLQEEWGFSDTAGGFIPTAVTLAGLVVTLPAGYLADRANRRNVIAVMVASWSIIITGSALAPSFLLFFMTRIALGVADNVDTPSALSLMGDFYEPRRRSRAYGYQRMCYLIGQPIGILLGGIVAQLYGWRAAFFFMVLPGMLVALLVWRLPEPIRGAMDRAAARRAAEEDGTAPAPEPASAPPTEVAAVAVRPGGFIGDVGRLLGVRTIFFVYFGLMSLFFGIGGIFFWLPTYYRRVFELDPGPAGILTALVSVIGVIGGTVIGGAVGDRLHGRMSGARIVIGGSGLAAGCLVMGVAFAMGSLWWQFGILTVSVVIMATSSPNLTAAIADVIPAPLRGIGFALVTFLMAVGSAFGPLVVGFVSDRADLTVAFYVLIVPMVIGSIVVFIGRSTFDRDAAEVLEMARRDAGL